MLDFLLGSARTRLAVLALLLCGGATYFRHQVSSMQRVVFAGLEYIEDTAAGNGTRYRVITRSSDTGGSEAEVEVLIRPGAPGFHAGHAGSLPYHSHEGQEEAVRVLEGELGWVVDGKVGRAAAGETLLVPAGAAHTLWCASAAGGAPVLARATLSPGGRMGERFFEQLAGLGATYGDPTRIHPLQLVALCAGGGVKLEGVPQAVSWALANVLPPFAQLLGFLPEYGHYVSAGAPPAEAAAEG